MHKRHLRRAYAPVNMHVLPVAVSIVAELCTTRTAHSASPHHTSSTMMEPIPAKFECKVHMQVTQARSQAHPCHVYDISVTKMQTHVGQDATRVCGG